MPALDPCFSSLDLPSACPWPRVLKLDRVETVTSPRPPGMDVGYVQAWVGGLVSAISVNIWPQGTAGS